MINHDTIYIVSVFCPNEYNEFWYSTQKKFIVANTTVDFVYKVYLNGCDITGINVNDVLLRTDINQDDFKNGSISVSINHCNCLKNIQIENKFKYFLLLDSDCFPILYNWNKILINKMAQFGFNKASIIRPENLDMFPHPSAMFYNNDSFDEYKPAILKNLNLIGREHSDVSCEGDFMPLLRTNRINVHPICAGIYYDMFYHHGAGSRKPIFRSTDIDKYYDYADHKENASLALSKLMSNPDEFINYLKGSTL